MNKKKLIRNILLGSIVAVGAMANAEAAGETVIYSFGNGGWGATPKADLLNVKGTLYGTTKDGGALGQGTAFELSTNGYLDLAHVFGSVTGDGSHPNGTLINVDGLLFGTTSQGGQYGYCTVFELMPPSMPGMKWEEFIIYSFAGGADGATPLGGLIDIGGKLYGTTSQGGAHGSGTVFGLKPPTASSPHWKETVLHSFGGGNTDGAYPMGQLTTLNGKLYGTTYHGGLDGCSDSVGSGCGTVFKLVLPSKKTVGGESVVHFFSPGGSDGTEPATGPIAVNGKLYGTTVYGGSNTNCQSDVSNCGTVYELTPPVSSGGAWTETALYAFKGGSDDGAFPGGTLLNVNGTLYGTTEFGGSGDAGNSCWKDGSNLGCGTVFKLTPPVAPETQWTESLVYSFGSSGGTADGATPLSGLVNVNGTLYGTTAAGSGTACSSYFYEGSYGCGTVFAITP